MELKYKENSLWKVAGSLWLLIALMNLGLMLFMLSGINRGFGLMISPIYIFIILISVVLTVFFFRLTKIDYLRLNECTLSIHRGLVLPRKKINISEVEQGRVIGNRFFLILENQKEVEINLKQLTIKDYEKLKLTLENYFQID